MPCGTDGAKPPPVCWNGSPYQPVPVANDVDTQTALTIMERRRDFPGISARLEAVREYPAPFNVNAAHMLGYLGPVTEEQLAEQGDSTAYDRLRRTDVVGRTGLESVYDEALRGKPGITTLAVDTAGNVTGTLEQEDPQAGNYVVTSIDAKLQAVVEEQLVAAVRRAQAQGYGGKSGAAVVIDVRTGQVLAMASYPDLRPLHLDRRREQEAVQGAHRQRVALLERAIRGSSRPARPTRSSARPPPGTRASTCTTSTPARAA